MIKRMAFLFAAPSPKSTSRSVFEDLSAIQAFLLSPVGGAWKSDQIQTFENPDLNQVTRAIGNGRQFEYTLIYFAGQGESRKGKLPWPEIHMQLNSGEEISERVLNPASASCLMILDCSHQNLQCIQGSSASDFSAVQARPFDSTSTSTIYESSIAHAEKGLVKAYSTIVGSALPTQTSFTRHLLMESGKWSEEGKGVLFVGEAVALAKARMGKSEPNQQVTYLGGRRLRDFPFAIGRQSEA
jgi:hypothetical protein